MIGRAAVILVQPLVVLIHVLGIGVSSSLGYVLPAIIGLESMGIPSPGETALVLASQHKLQIWLVLVRSGSSW